MTLTGCGISTKTPLNPHLSYSVQDKYLQNLHSIFHPLTHEETTTRWGQEYELGLAFAKKLDLYRAITCFKRADILIHPLNQERKCEIEYQIINAYYLGKRYAEAIETFEESILASTDRTFIGFRDLLIILFDSYLHEDQKDKAAWMVSALEKYYPSDARRLQLTSAIQTADLEAMQSLAQSNHEETRLAELSKRTHIESPVFTDDEDDLTIYQTSQKENAPHFTFQEELEFNELQSFTQCKAATNEILHTFNKKKKDPTLAATLNATIPGAGYLYLGQAQTAFTSFWLNSLFIGATTYFFKQDNIPAALICLGFEAGWYFGGIIGVHENAHFYNQRLFEKEAHIKLRDHKLYPLLMLNHGF